MVPPMFQEVVDALAVNDAQDGMNNKEATENINRMGKTFRGVGGVKYKWSGPR